ncbi:MULTISPECIES: FecR family protein [Parabacteroides]|jgi:transmembrane sensor|uniref:FecR protein domain-containing protein n=1 Tax=Parabacteroides goldsteinii DSM 19448 = WAL 12034 TaxID=927665 RepID=A0A0F5JJI3_9BACT|nr:MULTISPECIES: FecR domain-containing protein [Parabacteroides]KKB57735.1 hypothetical protein HMPREF1535_01182 [Parabacteroides goldsteinii DSM 19448 = WAL 12034]RKU68310.1 DUF4974 domain-containing protein [Parabacteroides sp. AF17-3]
MDKRIEKYFYEELSPEERLSLLHDVEANEELKRQFAEYQNMYALLNLGHQMENREVGKDKFDQFISAKQRGVSLKLWVRRLSYAAVVAVLVVSSSILTYLYMQNSLQQNLLSNTMNTLYTPAGQRAQLVLQDGTEVWLNAKSRLVYPAQFVGKERRVTVEGEAFFNVAKNPSKPFIVSTQDIDMKVLGTQFNVYCYPDAGYIQTSLLEGTVKVFFPDKEKEGIILKPDQQVTVSEGKMIVSQISLEERFLWREGIYAFENEPLIDILKKMELYYDVRIIVKDASLFNDTYTGKFRQRDSLDDVFRVLQQIRKFKVEKDKDRNIITLSK